MQEDTIDKSHIEETHIEESVTDAEMSKVDVDDTDNADTYTVGTNNTDTSVESLHEQVSALQDKLLRSVAETENVRRRYEKMLEETREYSVTNFAKDLLIVMDNLYRALEYKNKDDITASNIITGVEMTQKELESVMQKHGILQIAPNVGDPFNYNIHQAISQNITDDYEDNSVINTMQFGYKIKERLLRPAIVVVSKRAP